MPIRPAYLFAAILLPGALCCQVTQGENAASNACAARAIFQAVHDLLGKAQYESAATMLTGLRSCKNLSPVENFEMGWLFGQSRHFATALEIFDKLPIEIPDRSTHSYAVALSKFELGDFKGAIQELEGEPSGSGADSRSANLLAVSYSKLGLYRNAYAVLSAEVQKHPNDLTTYLNLATVCAEGGDYKKSAEIGQQATQLFPQSPEAFIFSGAANSLLGYLDRAYGDFSEAAHLAPDRPDARFLLAVTQYKQGNYADALKTLEEAGKEGLDDSDLSYLTAECLLKIDRTKTQAALVYVNHAIELNGRSVSALTLRGKLLMDAGRPKDAVPDLELATRIQPNSRAAVYNLARVYRAVGKTSQAQALFAKLRTANTDVVTEASDRHLNEALREEDGHP